MAQTYDARRQSGTVAETPNAWAIGWTVFAAIMMLINGAWWLMAGIVALVNDQFYVATEDYLFRFDITTWGWIHLLMGVLVIAAGLGLFSGATWARVTGVVLAGLATLVAFAWLPWYPLWGLLFIAASVFSIWALTAHSEDLSHATTV